VYSLKSQSWKRFLADNKVFKPFQVNCQAGARTTRHIIWWHVLPTCNAEWTISFEIAGWISRSDRVWDGFENPSVHMSLIQDVHRNIARDQLAADLLPGRHLLAAVELDTHSVLGR